ncbi:AMP-binding protein [Thalassotalea euphylliae]|uniref:AMP-binding protein n=1 Tax=Thalassotalea euphylliae TaxID=1655234 RepID=A0A3E0TM29_9GAMM|nr:AMP-binding protein [Thalassotalea euphylliae]REL25611.1 AMP-binding protein [Thalassotalea euphylliae]
MIDIKTKPTNVYQLLQTICEQQGEANAFTLIKQLTPELVDESVTYQTLLSNIHRTVRLIRDHLDINDESCKRPVVSFLLPNIPEAQYIIWAAETCGIANPINPLLNVEALSALMEKADTDIIFALGPNPQSDFWQKAQAVVEQSNKPIKLIPVAIPDGDNAAFGQRLSGYSDAPLPSHWLPTAEDVAAYFHTGGTTGSPKLVMHTHANHVAAANAYVVPMQSDQQDTFINGLPLFHVAGGLVVGLGGLAAGIHTVFPTMAGFRNKQVISQYWQLIAHYGVTVGGAIPTSLAALINVPIEHDISSLRYLISGGASLPESVGQKITEMTGLELYQIYGMTETSGVIAMPNLSAPAKLLSTGSQAAGVEITIDELSPDSNGIGEICVRGDTVFAGYLGSDESPLTDGWLRTGDLGYLDADGSLFITGRSKDLIIRSGHNIDPVDIESCLESHPAVALAAAVSKPDAYAGELPVAYVQLEPAAKVSIEELMAYAKQHIAEPPAHPKAITVLDALPMTAVGKLQKTELRTLAALDAVKEQLAAQLPEIDLVAEAKMLSCGKIFVDVSAHQVSDSLVKTCAHLAETLNLEVNIRAC